VTGDTAIDAGANLGQNCPRISKFVPASITNFYERLIKAPMEEVEDTILQCHAEDLSPFKHRKITKIQ
jgi:hypothetical protein